MTERPRFTLREEEICGVMKKINSAEPFAFELDAVERFS